MLSQPDLDRIDRRCAAVMVRAVNAFPGFLENCDAHDAAIIVADLIKTQLARPPEPGDPSAALAEAVKRASERVYDQCPDRQDDCPDQPCQPDPTQLTLFSDT